MRTSRQTHMRLGFTLVEMVIYIAVLSIVSLGAVTALLSLDDLIAKYRAEQLVFRSASNVLERFVHDVRASRSVTSASHIPPSSLSLSGSSGTITYATSSDALHVTHAGTDLGALTKSGVAVTQLRFYAYDDVSEFVRIELTLEATVGETTVERTFRSGAVLRSSYE